MTMSRQRFPCHDRDDHHKRLGCDGAWLRPRDFVSRQIVVMLQQDFTELCCDRVFYVTKECGQDQRALCCNTTFCVVTELVKARSFYVTTKYFCIATKFGLEQGRDIIFLCRDKGWPNERFYVTIENFKLRHSWPGWEDFMSRPSIFMSRHSWPRQERIMSLQNVFMS